VIQGEDKQMRRKSLPSFDSLVNSDAESVLRALQDQPDSVRVLVIGNYLDQALTVLLAKRLFPGKTRDGLLDLKGVLGTYQARVDLSYCLELITKSAKHNLDLIGQIRNIFAHTFSVLTFEDEEIAKLCDLLSKCSDDPEENVKPGDIGFDDVRHPGKKFGLAAAWVLLQVLHAGQPTTSGPLPKGSTPGD
jgi:hypothetical protein